MGHDPDDHVEMSDIMSDQSKNFLEIQLNLVSFGVVVAFSSNQEDAGNPKGLQLGLEGVGVGVSLGTKTAFSVTIQQAHILDSMTNSKFPKMLLPGVSKGRPSIEGLPVVSITGALVAKNGLEVVATALPLVLILPQQGALSELLGMLDPLALAADTKLTKMKASRQAEDLVAREAALAQSETAAAAAHPVQKQSWLSKLLALGHLTLNLTLDLPSTRINPVG